MKIYFKKYFVFIFLSGVLLFFSTPDFLKANTDFSQTYVEVLVSCGDGLIDQLSGEICDPGTPGLWPEDVGTSTCADFNDVFGDPFESGDLHCDDCYSFSTSSCFTCGNVNLEEEEDCDGNLFGNNTCISLGFDSGSLVCTPSCQLSTVNCVAKAYEGGSPGGGGGGGSRGGSAGSSQGYDPGAETENETKIVVRGKSYPQADVHILVDGAVIGIVKTDSKADFYFETTDISPGVANFGFWSEDVDGLKSTLLTLTFRVISGAVTNISGVYISPSINIDNKSVKQGDDVTIYGQTVPGSTIKVHINSIEEHIERADSEDSGRWQLVFNTEPLEEDFHTAKAYFEVESDENVIKSGFSKLVSFYVGREGGEMPCPEGDLNHDGRVNITDFSILLYYWGTDDLCSDQNQNGTVDLIDFSIVMYYWTG